MKIKKWFEANFLDGDKIQDGQTLSSAECFEAVCLALKEQREEIIEKIEKEIWKMPIETVGNSAKTVDQILEIISKIKA